MHARALFLTTAATLNLVAAAAAHAGSVTYTAGFREYGGDASYGNGDTSVNTALYGGFLPLFNSSLGTLDKVTIEMSMWRIVEFTCRQGEDSAGSCNARADGQFVLRADSFNPYQFPVLSILNAAAATPTWLTPPPGTMQSDFSYAEAETAFDLTDPRLLSVHFDGAGKNPAETYFTLFFQPLDGGSFGDGAGAAITAIFWDADATLSMTYHYTPAVPEPGAYALMLAGLGAIAWVARRRRAG